MSHVITFAQQKGGSGKTTLLVHLADAARRAGASVAIADLDPQGSLGAWAQVGGAEGLSLLETASYRVGGDLRAARGRYDWVFVDCPGSATSVLEAALRESDRVLLPCQPTPLDAWAIGPVLQMAAREKSVPRVVLNRVAPRGAAADRTEAALRAAGAEVYATRIGNRTAYAQAMGDGLTALALSGQARAAEEIAALFAELQADLA